MSLDYPPLNPQPVTLLSGGSVSVTNLGAVEGSLATIATNSTSSSIALSESASGVNPLGTKDLTITELLKEISLTLKLIKKHAELLTEEQLKETDLEIGD